jgi:hypothetical protein
MLNQRTHRFLLTIAELDKKVSARYKTFCCLLHQDPLLLEAVSATKQRHMRLEIPDLRR